MKLKWPLPSFVAKNISCVHLRGPQRIGAAIIFTYIRKNHQKPNKRISEKGSGTTPTFLAPTWAPFAAAAPMSFASVNVVGHQTCRDGNGPALVPSIKQEVLKVKSRLGIKSRHHWIFVNLCGSQRIKMQNPRNNVNFEGLNLTDPSSLLVTWGRQRAKHEKSSVKCQKHRNVKCQQKLRNQLQER